MLVSCEPREMSSTLRFLVGAVFVVYWIWEVEEMPLFVLQSTLVRTDSTSSLGTLLYEVSPSWRNCMCSCRRPQRGNWPQDTLKIHVAFIEAMANLELYVVRVMHYCFNFYLVLFLLKTFQILLEKRYKHDQYNDSLLSVAGVDLGNGIHSNSSSQVLGMRLSCQF